MKHLIDQHIASLAPFTMTPPLSRYMDALARAEDCDLQQMLLYNKRSRYDKRAFYLACETLARRGCLVVEKREDDGRPVVVRIEDGARVRAAWGMFFDDTKTQYNVQKRFIDLQWMLLVSEDEKARKCLLLAERKPGVYSNRKLYQVPNVGSLVVVSDIGMIETGCTMVWVKHMPTLTGLSQRSKEELERDLSPERLVSAKHLQSLLVRMEAFWIKRLRSQLVEGALSAMEQCFYETLETLTEKKAIAWDGANSFKILNPMEWRRATKIFCGHRMCDAMVAWVRLLGWVSTDDTVPAPGRSTDCVPCLTFRKLSAEEKRDLKLFDIIFTKSMAARDSIA